MTATSRIGYALSSEEHPPLDLVRHAAAAEDSGFEFALISDHFHPWVDRQGNSPFVWSVLGAIAGATERLEIGTGVTCPTIRIHPAIIAQAAATVAALMPGRFFLGVGTGENLNEHVLGQRWPEWDVRAEMLEEAIEVIRLLWAGDEASHHGRYYTVENARLYTLPEELPPIYVAGSGERMATTAGRDRRRVHRDRARPRDRRAYDRRRRERPPDRTGHSFLGPDGGRRAAGRARLVADCRHPRRGDPGAAQAGPLRGPGRGVTEDQVAEVIPCGPDPGPILEQDPCLPRAGYDHVYLHQVGPDQRGFLEFAARELLTEFAGVGTS